MHALSIGTKMDDLDDTELLYVRVGLIFMEFWVISQFLEMYKQWLTTEERPVGN